MMVLMETTLIYLSLVLIGLCLGSFGGAMVWRLRARQLIQDKAAGEPYDMGEYNQLKKLTQKSQLKDRSQCLHCSYALRWYDMVPLASWLTLRGKCRQCRTPIGYLEPLMELGVALFFVVSFTFWPYGLESIPEIARFVTWLVAGVGLAILFAYDAKWYLLPDRVSLTVVALGILSAALVVIQSTDVPSTLVSIAGSVFVLSGIYYVLYLVSKGRWIGFGDIKLGLGLALLLSDWKLAFIALFTANFIGCLIVIPAMLAGKLQRSSHVPFGPLLILGAIIAALAGPWLVQTYLFGLI